MKKLLLLGILCLSLSASQKLPATTFSEQFISDNATQSVEQWKYIQSKFAGRLAESSDLTNKIGTMLQNYALYLNKHFLLSQVHV